jgi:hypothetical protein
MQRVGHRNALNPVQEEWAKTHEDELWHHTLGGKPEKAIETSL